MPPKIDAHCKEATKIAQACYDHICKEAGDDANLFLKFIIAFVDLERVKTSIGFDSTFHATDISAVSKIIRNIKKHYSAGGLLSTVGPRTTYSRQIAHSAASIMFSEDINVAAATRLTSISDVLWKIGGELQADNARRTEFNMHAKIAPCIPVKIIIRNPHQKIWEWFHTTPASSPDKSLKSQYAGRTHFILPDGVVMVLHFDPHIRHSNKQDLAQAYM